MNAPRRLVLLAASLLASVTAIEAATEATPVRAFRSFDRRTARRLPQSTVMGLAQDTDGVLWIATLDGVATFDGASLELVPDTPGAPHAGPASVVVARRSGGVAVAGAEAVSIREGRRWRRVPTPGAAVALAEAVDGGLWIADRAGDVWRLPAGGTTWERRSAPETGPIAAIAATADGVWLAGRDGVWRVGAGGLARAGGSADEARDVSALLVTAEGEAWIGTGGGAVLVAGANATRWTRVALSGWPGGRIRCLARDRVGRVWAGGSDGAVAFGRRDGAWSVWGPANGIRPYGIMAIVADREGSLWFGLNGGGLQQWVGDAWSHRSAWDEDVGGGAAQVFGITGTRDGFLAAVFSHGIWRWDGRALQRYGREQGLTEDVRQAVEPAPGELWVAARFGIFESAGGSFRRTLRLSSGFAAGFFQAPDGSWYAATTASGVYVRRNGSWEPATDVNRDLPDPNVHWMTWRRDGTLWIATQRGVCVFRDGRGRVLAPDSATGFPDAANAILEVDDAMWVAGFGGLGIHRDGKWRVLRPADGLPGNTIYSLARGGDGAVWAGGSSGVGRLAGGKWTVWDAGSGLIEDECNSGGLWVAPDGAVYVGTMASLARFDARLEPPPAPPLRVLWRHEAPPGLDGVVRLPVGARRMHLAWTAPWLLPRPVEYRTRVAGLDDWSAPGRTPELAVENLGPGLWTAEVQARLEGDGDGAWTAPATARVAIAPYWWETTFARAAFGLVLASALVGLVGLRTRRLRERGRELERLVEQRTQSLVELTQRLGDSNRGLQEAVRMREDLVSIVAHDIRSPLTVIQGYAELLLNQVTNEEWREILARIGSQSVHLASLAADILTMSRIESGVLALERRPIDLALLVRSLLDVRFADRPIELASGPGLATGARATVFADEGALSEVVDNLLTNAVKYSPDGGRVIVTVDRDALHATVAVADHGIGIPPEDVPRLFQRFTRLDGALQRRIPGSGLGLYICRWIVEAHGGFMRVESRPGAGSTFSLTLPLATEAEAGQADGRSSSRS